MSGELRLLQRPLRHPFRRLALSAALSAVALVAASAPAPAAATLTAADAAAEVDFAVGVAAYLRGDYDEAVERLSAAVAGDPDNAAAESWLERARAAAAAAEAGDDPPPEPPPPAVDLGRFGELPAWELEVRAAVGDDSNPALIADGVVALAPDGTVLVGPRSDRATELGARFDLRPLRGSGPGGWTLGLTLAADQVLYDELDFADLTRLAGTAHLVWGGDPAGFLSGPLGSARVPIGHRRAALLLQGGVTDDEIDGVPLATTTHLAGSLFVRQGAVGTTRLSARYGDQDFDPDGTGVFEASGTVVEAEVEQTFYLGPRHRYLRLAAAAGERDAGAAFDAEHLRGRAELGLPLSASWTLTLAGSYESRDFDGVESNPLFGRLPVDESREDTATRLAAAVTWAVTPRLLLTARGSRTDRDADLGPVAEQFFDFDYDRTVVAVGFRWFFLPGGAS